MSWYKDISSILKNEPEIWIAYLYGQQLENLPALRNKKATLRGFTLQTLKFIIHLTKNIGLKNHISNKKNVEYVAYAGSINQKASLDKTISALRSRNIELVALIGKEHINKKSIEESYFEVSFSIFDIYRALILLTTRGPTLYRKLRKTNIISAELHYSTFCQSYIYLAYFWRVLRDLHPDFVITTNDHNTSNRSMLAVANFLNIKTVYLQHASVTNLFPALRVDYAFLDGQSALETYRLCEKNQPQPDLKTISTKIILSGQKKTYLKISE